MEEFKTYNQVIEYAKVNWGLHLTKIMLMNHKKKHIDLSIRKAQLGKDQQDRLDEILSSDIEIAMRLNRHLNLIEKQVESFSNKTLTPEEAKVAVDWLNQARLTIEQLLKWKERLMPDEFDLEQLGSKLIDLVKDFPDEYLKLFSERLMNLLNELKEG